MPSNFYLRADSGQIGKFNMSAWGSKRSVLSVYANGRSYNTNNGWGEEFKPSLRYYGDEKNVGINGNYAFNEKHKIFFTINHDREDVERKNKNADPNNSLAVTMEPLIGYKRTMERNNYSIRYTGRSHKFDWQVDIRRGQMEENDIARVIGGSAGIASGKDQYGGKNELYSIDWLKHEQTNVNIGIKNAVNDKHLINYGLGYIREKAVGSRLRNAPKTYVQHIDPWDYDKSLKVIDNTAGKDDIPVSYIHNYKLENNANGFYWDRDGEYYGQTKPLITYNELSNWYSDKTQIVYGYFDYHGQQIAQKTTLFDLYKNGIDGYEKKLQQALTLGTISDVQYKKYIDLGNTLGKKFDAFNKILKEQNPKYDFHYQKEALVYYGLLNSGTTLDPKDVKIWVCQVKCVSFFRYHKRRCVTSDCWL
jgi:hypothetical protein